MKHPYDVAIVGAGIAGLAHARAAARIGKRVVVIDRDMRANGASIRNFGFITVTGQQRGQHWNFALRTRDIWAEIAPQAGIDIEQKGLLVTMRRPEALGVAEAFLKTEMGQACQILTKSEMQAQYSEITAPGALAALYSPHELRVESRTALPKLAAWLAATHNVTFLWETAVYHVAPPRIETARGPIEAEAAIICPNDDFVTLFPDRIAAFNLRKCRLSMLRLQNPGFRLPAALMSDLSLARYTGYAALPEATPLRARLQAEQAAHLENGVHLIVVQSADGSLVVGDSHHYADLPGPFAPAQAETCILDEFHRATGLPPPQVTQRWVGIYPVAENHNYIMDSPADSIRLVIVTSGTGASTSFAIAEATIANLFGAITGKPI